MDLDQLEKRQVLLLGLRAGLELDDALETAGLTKVPKEMDAEVEAARNQEARGRLMAHAVIRSFGGAAGPRAARDFIFYLEGEEQMQRSKELTTW